MYGPFKKKLGLGHQKKIPPKKESSLNQISLSTKECGTTLHYPIPIQSRNLSAESDHRNTTTLQEKLQKVDYSTELTEK